MKKNKISVISLLISAMLIICILFCSCHNDYNFFDTDNVNEYFELKNEKDAYFRIFPEQIDNLAEASFSYCEYNYHSFDVDVILICKYNDESAYKNAVDRETERIKERYNVYEIDGFAQGYTNMFVGSLLSSEDYTPHIQASLWLHDNSYHMSHTLVCFSPLERTIIYNYLTYNSQNNEKYGHTPYILEKLNADPFFMDDYSLSF